MASKILHPFLTRLTLFCKVIKNLSPNFYSKVLTVSGDGLTKPEFFKSVAQDVVLTILSLEFEYFARNALLA